MPPILYGLWTMFLIACSMLALGPKPTTLAAVLILAMMLVGLVFLTLFTRSPSAAQHAAAPDEDGGRTSIPPSEEVRLPPDATHRTAVDVVMNPPKLPALREPPPRNGR